MEHYTACKHTAIVNTKHPRHIPSILEASSLAFCPASCANCVPLFHSTNQRCQRAACRPPKGWREQQWRQPEYPDNAHRCSSQSHTQCTTRFASSPPYPRIPCATATFASLGRCPGPPSAPRSPGTSILASPISPCPDSPEGQGSYRLLRCPWQRFFHTPATRCQCSGEGQLVRPRSVDHGCGLGVPKALQPILAIHAAGPPEAGTHMLSGQLQTERRIPRRPEEVTVAAPRS